MPFVFNPISNQFDITNVGGGGGNFKDPVGLATTTDLDALYDNGTAGVGATLTNNGPLIALEVDGITPTVGSRVLVKNQIDLAENGVYIVTDVGSGVDPWILTRATDYDEPSEIAPGDLFPITSGVINGATIWEQVQTVTTIGTDPFQFIEFNNKELSISPYIVGASKSDFIFIQDAIDEAVAQGYDSTNPVNIYVKPLSGGWLENILMADGINVLGLCSGNDSTPVILKGEITWPDDCSAILQNVKLEPTGSNSIILQGGTLNLLDSYFNLGSLKTAIYLEGTTVKTINLNNVSSNDLDFVLFDSDSSAQSATITINQCQLKNTSISTLAWSGTLSLNAIGSLISTPFNIDIDSLDIQYNNCKIETPSEVAFETSATTEGTINLVSCEFSGDQLFNIGSADLVVSTPYCLIQEAIPSTFASGQSFAMSKHISTLDSAEVFEQSRTGWRGANTKYSQSFLQTTDDTPTVLASVPISELESITFNGSIVAASTDHSAGLNGKFTFGARRETAGNVTINGSPYKWENTTSALTFDLVVNTGTQTMDVLVTGEAATTYNWTCSFDWVTVRNNT